jgi:MFS family permease
LVTGTNLRPDAGREPSPPAEGILGPRRRRLTVGIVATILLVAFEAMAVATAMPIAVRDLDGLPLYAWAFSGFFTASLVGMVVAGGLCDRRGPRLPLVAGVATFTAGLVVAGVAPSMWPFILGRATQGLGGGLVIVAVYVVVARAYPEDIRPRMFSAMAAAWVLPSIVGPLVAGTLADRGLWRLVFLGIVPLVLLPLVLVMPSLRAVDGPPPTGPVVRRGRLRLALAAAAGMGLLQYAGQRRDLVALGFVLVALGLVVPSVPRLLPRGTLRFARGLPTVVAMRGVLAGAFFGAEAFVPLMLVEERGLSATLAGLALTGGALGWAAGSWYQGRPRLRMPRYALVRVGSGIVAAGIAGVALVLLPTVPAPVAAVAWTLGAVGMGMSMASLSVLLFEMSPPQDQGANSAALQITDALFSITFVGLGGVIFNATHRPGGDTEPVVFAAIFAVMAALASFGAVVAGRMRPGD